MKKSLIFILFLMISAHLHASFLHKVLRTTLVGATLGTVGLNMNTMYNTVKEPEFDIEKNMGAVIFDDELQQMLRENFKSIYTLQKPLFFAASPVANNVQAYADKNNNYIMYGYTFLPTFEWTQMPERRAGESDEAFNERWEHYTNVHHKEHEDHAKFLRNPPKQELLEKLQHISMAGKHEIGHLVHEHVQERKNARNFIIMTGTTLNIVFGAHMFKDALTKTISKAGLLGRIVSIGALLPVTGFCSLYSLAAMFRKQECEADDFAIKHATSKQELQAHIDVLNNYARADLLRNMSPSERRVRTLFSTHPSTESRIAKLHEAIASWKD